MSPTLLAPLGRFLILCSLLVASCGAVVAYAAGARRSPEGLQWARRFAARSASSSSAALRRSRS